MTISPDAPLFRRFSAYLAERFPPLGHILLIVSYFSSNQFLAQALTEPDRPLRYSLWSLAGGCVVLAGFFTLRVFDEHKDFEEDKRFHPNRLLQSGVITLRELRLFGYAAITIQIVLSALRGPAAFLSTVMVLGFAVLMLKEFFIGPWLKRHFFLYTLSHMLIMPLYALQIFSFTTQRFFFDAPFWFIVYAFVGFFVTLNWEISRKIRAPEEEVVGLDTYSGILGTYGAGYAVLLVRAIDTMLVAAVGRHLELGSSFYFLLILLYAACLYGFLDFRFRTSPKTAKRMELYAGIYIIAFDLVLAMELARVHGVTVEIG